MAITNRYTQVSISILCKSSNQYYVIFVIHPSDHWFWGTEDLADQHYCLPFGNLSYRWQRVDEARWLR